MVEISCECFYVCNVVADMYSTSMVGSMLLQCLYRTHNSTQGDASKLKVGCSIIQWYIIEGLSGKRVQAF